MERRRKRRIRNPTCNEEKSQRNKNFTKTSKKLVKIDKWIIDSLNQTRKVIWNEKKDEENLDGINKGIGRLRGRTTKIKAKDLKNGKLDKWIMDSLNLMRKGIKIEKKRRPGCNK